ncbi:beta-ketoacyl-[acyl-carrier-protein] synthase family protein, partial [Amycolatopsis rhizosphaerae]
MHGNGASTDVVISGLGFLLPGATGKDEAWRVLAAGDSQVRTLPDELRGGPGAAGRCRAGARVTGFDHRRHLPDLPDNHAKRYSRDILMVLAAVEQACADAGVRPGDVDPDRLAVIGSCSRGPVEWWSQTCAGRVPDPRYPPIDVEEAIFASLPGTPAALSAIRLGARGMVTTLSNACVGGHQAIGLGAELLRAGTGDVVIAVGYEAPFVPEMLRLYSSPTSRVLS